MDDYEEHFSDTEICIVAFASGDNRIIIPDVPNFEFGNHLEKLGASFVLMRDSTGGWYHNGIKGLGDREQVALYIDSLKDRYTRIIATGTSLGSYGALLYGQLAPVDEVIAISPLTVLGNKGAPEFERKWRHRIESPDLDLDLKPFFAHGPRTKIRAFITDGDGAELDHYMATRLGITDITLIPGHTHGALAKHMRDTRWFERLFV